MRYFTYTKIGTAAIAALTSFLIVNAANAALFVSKKEILRQTRVEWLTMKKSLPIHPSERVQSYVGCIAYRIIETLDEEYRNLDWEVIVFDDDMANASVLPSGKIAVFSGILEVADTPDALAAVIGHETAHLTEDHVMQRAKANSRTDALVLLANAATGLGGMIREGTQIGLMLPYQRDQESEADIVGMQYMAKAGYDPRATLYLWKNMNERQGNRRPSEFVSTHPSPDTRMADLARNMTPALIEYNNALEAGLDPGCYL